MANTFPKFLQLPWEIQHRIWKYTVEPRIVKIRKVQVMHAKCVNCKGSSPAYKLVTSTPVPAVLQTCYQARYKHRLYQQVFSELDTVRSGEERRYVWMNLDIDTVDAGFLTGLTLFHFQDVARSIRRLKVEIDWISCACGARAALHACFGNLQELEMTVSDETFLDRQSTAREQLCSGYMPRSLKKLVVHTTADGLTSQWDESVGDDDPQHIRWIRDSEITSVQRLLLESYAAILSKWQEPYKCKCCSLGYRVLSPRRSG
ncbi:hypothetical protein NCU08801 [Neurospora crassa OR74A]|uniref:2EXR domain-containing protein n=1 Tax=Neurospora crassa (strain ATCC 24698 / 74-OR23-1A / CBS 708.71 / DSM 1257 / FGSC 987) TaxID=367110 RepID=Q7S8T3_NEUCR|nr:hypothetical protein NCU08801 [Neurospora crassa OR74A]EAA32752.1 hypothetical protein NCU08801 [Neurospora crassa OR74A]|eukprot:XP_961988.1 hypothetical protein NCU08801 [Neurospora crassa OR74A]